MPSGKTHDAITFLTAIPAFAGAYSITGRLSAALVLTSAYLFGGLMFGPDLDTVSRQYSRWSVFRFVWIPYRSVFKHRSRFSHGLIFGSLLRVIYFKAILTAIIVVSAYAWTWESGGRLPGFVELTRTWNALGAWTYSTFGEHFLLITFIGLWLGAASHTFTDMAGSFIKTGRVVDFL